MAQTFNPSTREEEPGSDRTGLREGYKVISRRQEVKIQSEVSQRQHSV